MEMNSVNKINLVKNDPVLINMKCRHYSFEVRSPVLESKGLPLLKSIQMKNIVIILLFTLYAFDLSAQESDKKLILELLETQRSDWNRGDIAAYMQGYIKSDSLLFVGKNGPEYGWENTLMNYKKGYPDQKAMGFLSFDIKEVRLISVDHAFVLGAWNLKREKDEPKGFFTLLLRKTTGGWKIVADHSG